MPGEDGHSARVEVATFDHFCALDQRFLEVRHKYVRERQSGSDKQIVLKNLFIPFEFVPDRLTMLWK